MPGFISALSNGQVPQQLSQLPQGMPQGLPQGLQQNFSNQNGLHFQSQGINGQPMLNMGQMPPQGMPQGSNLMGGHQGIMKPNFFPNAPGQHQSMGHPSINMYGLQNFQQNQMGLQNPMGNMSMGGNGVPPPFLQDGQNSQTHQPNVQFNPMPGVGMDHRFMPNFGQNLTQINSQAMIQGGHQARFFNPGMTITNPNEGNGDMKMKHNFPVNSNNSQPPNNPDVKNNYLGVPPPLKHTTENRSDSKSRNKKSSRRADKYSSNSSISRSPSQNRHSKTNKGRGQSRNHRNPNKGLQTISEEGKSNRHSERRSSVSRSRSRNEEIGRNGKDKRGSDPRGKTGNPNNGNNKNLNGRNQSQKNQNNQNNQNNKNNQNHQKSTNKNNKNNKNNDNNSKNAKNKQKKNEKNTIKYDQPKKHPSDDDRIRNSDSKGGSGESGDKKPDQAKILELLGRIKGKENNSKKAPASKGDTPPEHDTGKKEKSTGSLFDDKNPKVEPKKKCQSLGSVNSGQSEKSNNGHAA
jgi:hypothetical protein